MAQKRVAENLKFAGEQIQSAFCHWHETGMVSTLGDLLRTLREVEDEMLCYDGDALIADHCDDLGITTDYVSLFGNPSEHGASHSAFSFSQTVGSMSFQ